MTEEVKLKPCPFCGSNAVMDNSGISYCSNMGCHAYNFVGYAHTWNNRPLEDAKDARIAELERQLADAKEEVKLLRTTVALEKSTRNIPF